MGFGGSAFSWGQGVKGVLGLVAASLFVTLSSAYGAQQLVEAESADASLAYTGTGWEIRSTETDDAGTIPYSEMPQVYGGQIRRSMITGDKVTLSFTGVSVSVIFHTKMENGIVDVKIDGSPLPSISLYNNTYWIPPDVFQMYYGACYKEIVIANNLANAAHTLELTVSGNRQFPSWTLTGTTIDIDAFRYGDFQFATIEGTVTDHDGDGVHREIDPNVRLTADPAKIDLAGPQNYTVYISDDGSYSLSGIVAGTYDITCSGPGYASKTANNVVIAAGAAVTQDFQLGFANGHYLWNKVHIPRDGTPVLRIPGESFDFVVNAASGASSWNAKLQTTYNSYDLNITSSTFDSVDGWTHTAAIPGSVPAELYDLTVTFSTGSNTSERSVKVYSAYRTEFYFIHHTDSQAMTDWSDFDAVLPEVNLINPEFVINTGDNIAGPWRPGGPNTPTEWDWKRWNDWEARWDGHTVATFSAPGNHCVGPGTVIQADHYKKRVGRRYNAERYGNYLLLTLDNAIFNVCNGYKYDERAYYDARDKWMVNVLQNNPSPTLTFLGIHVGMDSFTDLTNNSWYDEMLVRGTNGSWIDDYGVDMVCYGHWGNDSVTTRGPNNLLYVETRDITGSQAYRLVRVNGSNVVQYTYDGDPNASISAGSLSMSYASANNGSQTTNTATITNNLNEHFEQGQVKFVMQRGTYEVSSSPAGAAITQAVDSDDGNYTIVYVEYDIPQSTTSTVTVQPGSGNVAPTVDAGTNQQIMWPTDTVNLDGTVSDPDDTPTTLWTKQSGPGTVTFGNDIQVDTTATFSAIGVYVLELEADDGTNPVVSDTVTITVQVPTITVTAPTGGAFDGQENVTITWTSNLPGNVKIEFTDDGWSTSTTVVASTANDGSHVWALPNVTSADCAFRVSDLDGDPTDDSGTFSITRVEVAITSHPADANVTEGQAATFSVTATGRAPLSYQWQVDAGSGWGDIAGANGSSYTTPATARADDGNQYRCDVSNTVPSQATSNAATLTVVPLPDMVAVTAPAGGQFKGKQDVTITWTSNFPGDVKIEFAEDGVTWTTVVGSTANDGSHDWVLPNVDSTNCAFRVSDASDGDPTDDSVTFSIAAITDVDGDRMDDGWETGYWGDTTTSDGTGDSDGDGMTDLNEFWLGRDPTVNDWGGTAEPSGGCVPAGGCEGAAMALALGLSFFLRRRSQC